MRSLIGCKTTPVTRRLPGSGLLVYGRGVSCELTVDEEGFSGISPYLFGLVLEHYIARHVSINTFSQMTLHSMQRGHVMTWPVRTGQRGAYDRRSQPGAENPWRYGFLNLMRRVDAQLCDTPAGSIWQPRMEKFRLGQTPTMTFAPREIAQVSWQDGRLHLSLYSLGLWGQTARCRCTIPSWH